MAKGLKDGEPNGRDVYPDIIDHPHWQSPTRPHMSLYDRAAQFSSFDALAGYSDMVREEQRETHSQIELEENERERLDIKLAQIAAEIADGRKPAVTLTYFVPDQQKAGGEYVTEAVEIKKIDAIERKILLGGGERRGARGAVIDIDRVIDIS